MLKSVILGFLFAITALGCLGQSHLIDTTFSHDGWHTFHQGQKPRLLWDAVVQPDGKIVATGSYDNAASQGFPATFRFNSDGTPDLSFSGDGIQIDSNAIVLSGMQSIGQQSTGKIVVGGYGKDCSPIWSCSTVFTLFRYKTNGDRDSTFGDNGMVQTYPMDGVGVLADMVVLPDDKIVGVGYWGSGPGAIDVHLARYMPDGDLDSTFGANGLVYVPIGTQSDFGRSIVMQPDGKLLAAGYAETNNDKDAFIIRLLPNGSLDLTFGGGDGIFTLPQPLTQDDVSEICVLPDGKIFATGSAFANNATAQLDVRLMADGSLDTTFHSSGYHISQLFTIPYANTSSMACFAQPNGKVVISGYFTEGSSVQGMVQRLDANGNLDPTFNGIGYDTLDVSNDYAQFLGMALAPDGKMVMVGNYQIAFSFTQSYLVARYLNFDLMAGLENALPDFEMTIFPNPAHDLVTIQFPEEVSGNLMVVSLAGRVLMEKEVAGKNCDLKLVGLAGGVYWVVLQMLDGKVQVSKLVVQ